METGERERYVEEYRPERTRGEQLMGVMADRRVSKKLKGKLMSTCVTPACLQVRNENIGTDRTTPTKAASVQKQLGTKKSTIVTRADSLRRRMVELREETGVQRSLTERLVRSRLQWAGHV